ncbi:M1 family metallopeptidase [Panacibacter sp. DH6]|uniref:M1 family metallopeptidase n=1 Tax=Panacibacter microcysteis TaxID=2793269 RepID=A0A931E3J2_9BACT|nr:M1 family metallopeptidase [Panacibacter microcysteis]
MRFFVTAMLLLFVHNIYAQQTWQQEVNYTIDVTLNDAEHTLDGFEQINYINHSPDTLRYIFIHLWANAYKNDQTAFSEQLLRNGRTDFYFSSEEQRGYINRLEFKTGKETLVTEATKDIDVIKLLLAKPLAPNEEVTIATPFHTKLPFLFSRGGYYKQFYAITQWYPKAALYDKDGWHAMPYLDQGEFYNDFGNYHVSITLPGNYKVAATGLLTETHEGPTLKQMVTDQKPDKKKQPFLPKKRKVEEEITPSSGKQQTWVYDARHVTDFAWFADKRFIVRSDTIMLGDNIVKANCYILPENAGLYANSLQFTKQAIRFYSAQFGNYPYPAVNVVSAPKALVYPTSMEYPMLTMITESTEMEVDATIAHEVGHNWLMGILATNERDHAWMDEGINTFIERKYRLQYYPEHYSTSLDFSGLNGAGVHKLLNTTIGLKKDQPIDLTSDAYSEFNYGAVVYEKTADWMEYLEKMVGKDTIAAITRAYYSNFSFKHPSPADLKNTAEKVSGRDLTAAFNKIYSTGYIDSSVMQEKTKFSFGIPGFKEQAKYIIFTPVAGFNHYDKIMIGGMLHNYQLPLQKMQFLIAPVYATGSRKLNGTARLSYNHFTKRTWLEIATSGIRYSINDFSDEKNDKLYLGITRFVPSVKLSLYNKELREKTKWTFLIRSFILKEDQLNFRDITTPTDTFSQAYKTTANNLVNQLKISYENNRVLYPYNANVVIDQGKDFLRIGFTGKYFFNYNQARQGIAARVFAGKYFNLNNTNPFAAYKTALNMSGPKGDEDYTYSGYFIGRNEFEGWQSQQVMERDGFFKVRTDLLGDKIGKSDDWLVAINLSGDIPDKVNPLNALPFKLPIKLFLDIGTYSEAWRNDEAANNKILFDAGLQLSLFRGGLNVYVPLVYSKVYNDYFKAYLGDKRFAKNISFNINLDVFQLSKLSRTIPW